MIAPARRAAYHILLEVEQGSADLPHALARSRQQLSDSRDQALAAEIALGTLRWRARLDYVLAHFARRPVGRLDPEVLVVLRSAAYQLLYLTRVPASAVVNDSVSLVREVRKKSASGLVNAVLRALASAQSNPPAPERPAGTNHDQLADYYSVMLSHPRWLVSRWLARYGEAATKAWLEFNNQEAPLALRANRLLASRDSVAGELAKRGVETEVSSFAVDGLVVTKGNALARPVSTNGGDAFIVQDEASQMVGTMLPVGPNDVVLDACASPVCKTTQIAAATGDRAKIVACDVRTRRVELLRQTVERCGVRSVRLVQADFAAGAPFSGTFDAVLLDAPCSGLGTLRRDPDIKWRRDENDIQALAATQSAMLDNIAPVVRPGGFLLYATCSSEPQENEEVVDAFLARHGDFEQVTPSDPTLTPVLDSRGHLRTYPHVHGLEAFFGALLSRRLRPSSR